MSALATLDVKLPALTCKLAKPAAEIDDDDSPWDDFDHDLDRIPRARPRTRADRQRTVLACAAVGLLAITGIATWLALRSDPKAEVEVEAEVEPTTIDVEPLGAITIDGEIWCDPGELPTLDEIPDGDATIIIRHPPGQETRASQLADLLSAAGHTPETVVTLPQLS